MKSYDREYSKMMINNRQHYFVTQPVFSGQIYKLQHSSILE